MSLSGGQLREWPGGRVAWSVDKGIVTALACGTDRAVIGLAGPGGRKQSQGTIALLTRTPSGWIEQGRIETAGIPRKLILFRGRLAAILEERRSVSLAMMDAAPGAKVQVVPLSQAPTRIAVAPGGESFLVAAGSNLQSFRVAQNCGPSGPKAECNSVASDTGRRAVAFRHDPHRFSM